MTPSYTYRGLDDRHDIRLFELCPAIDGDATLRCRLKHVSINDGLSYRCLSYTWQSATTHGHAGITERSLAIIQDGEEGLLPITENLATYLDHLQKIQESPTWLWVDAVCINQKDDTERGHQILLMNEIFKNAEEVVAWLGPAGDDSDLAFELMKSMPHSEESDDSGSPFYWWTEEDRMALQRDITSNVDSINKLRHWQAMIALMNRPWWRRTWVIQEARLARHLIFQCGEAHIEWEYVWRTLENLWKYSSWLESAFDEGRTLKNACNSGGRSVLFLRQGMKHLDLLQAIYHVRGSLATRPEDKIYGVLGMASDGNAIVPSPNYEKGVKETTSDFILNMTRVRKDLDWLMLCDHTIAPPDWPTWCPYLTEKPAPTAINTSRSVAGLKTRGFKAAGNQEPCITIDGKTLTLKGFVLDELDGLSFANVSGKNEIEHRWELEQPKSTARAYASDQACVEAIWKTAVADQDFEGTTEKWKAPGSFGVEFCIRVSSTEQQLSAAGGAKIVLPNAVERWYMHNRAFICMGKTIGEWAQIALRDQPETTGKSEADEFRTRLVSATGGRRLATTTKGRLALVMADAQRGDLVCILYGSRMPVILRPCGDNFKVIGESYVHGVMSGESVSVSSSETEVDRQFALV